MRNDVITRARRARSNLLRQRIPCLSDLPSPSGGGVGGGGIHHRSVRNGTWGAERSSAPLPRCGRGAGGEGIQNPLRPLRSRTAVRLYSAFALTISAPLLALRFFAPVVSLRGCLLTLALKGRARVTKPAARADAPTPCPSPSGGGVSGSAARGFTASHSDRQL